MWCPFCSFTESKVIDSRLNQDGDTTRRRRVCPNCESRFTTYERIEEVMPLVIKKDGRREDFRRDKLRSGIDKACQKRAIPAEKIEATIDGILKRVQAFGLKEVPAKTLGQMVMKSLYTLDSVAYIRFASVYQNFNNVPEFVAEIQEPPTPNEDPNSLTFAFASTDAPDAANVTSSAAGNVPQSMPTVASSALGSLSGTTQAEKSAERTP